MKPFPQPGAVTLLVVILITCLVLFLFQKIIWLVVPFLLSLMLYYCVRPVMRALVVRGMRHGTAAKLVWLVLQLMAATVVFAGGLLVVAKAGTWQNELLRYVAGGQTLLRETAGALERAVPLFHSMSLGAQIDQNFKQFTDGFAEKKLLPVLLQSLRWLPFLLLVPYIIYFMLNDSVRLKKYVVRSVPNPFFEKSLLLFSRLDTSLQNYFQGLLLLTFLDATCLGLGLGVLGIANALWLGLAAAVLAWIPYLGSLIGCIMVVLVAATDHPESARTAYACLALFLGVRLLDDFIFLPLTIGRKLSIHPVLTVLMLFLGGMVAGATGLVLALPLFGVIAVTGEAISQVVTDRKLRARYRATRQLVLSHETV
ncbi:MAG TPA: AI-2E family transporter [Verrucomicrobiae bacterium]|nr:AI-2E family transporter [Verrucomicrobiae bacterium]